MTKECDKQERERGGGGGKGFQTRNRFITEDQRLETKRFAGNV